MTQSSPPEKKKTARCLSTATALAVSAVLELEEYDAKLRLRAKMVATPQPTAGHKRGRPGRPPRSNEPTKATIVRMPASAFTAAHNYAKSQRRALNYVLLDGLAREINASGRPLPPSLRHPDEMGREGL